MIDESVNDQTSDDYTITPVPFTYDEYKVVPQDWVEYYDLLNIKPKIVFYEKSKDDNYIEVKSLNKHRIVMQNTISAPVYVPGIPLYVNLDDFSKLNSFIEEKKRIEAEEKRKRIEAEEKRKEEPKKNAILLIDKTKLMITDVIQNSNFFLEDEKNKLIEKIDDIKNKTQKDTEEDNEGRTYSSKNYILRNFILDINENIGLKHILKSYDELTKITTEDINIRKDKNTAEYMIKIKTSHIIFYYDFEKPEFKLRKMIKNQEYKIETNPNKSLSIYMNPPLIGDITKDSNIKFLFFIYKVEENEELDKLAFEPEPEPQKVEAKVEAPVEAKVEAPVEAKVEAKVEAPVEAKVEAKVKSNVEEAKSTGYFNDLFNKTRRMLKRDATINPSGGKRTRKQKKTRKHKKAHRKIIHKKNNTIVQKLNFRNKR